MRRIRYSVAASLDGYIAGPAGELDWIQMDPEIDFEAAAARFDTYLMGRRTYEAALKGGPSLLRDMDVWVFSRTLSAEEHPGVTIVADAAEDRIRELRSRPGREICLFGGGDLFRSLLEMDQVDVIEVAVIPTLLGDGTPLLPATRLGPRLSLVGHRLYPATGTMLLEYSVVR